MSEDKDIQRIREEEERRGLRKPPPDEQAIQDRANRRRQLRLALQGMSWEKASAVLVLQPGTTEYEEIHRIWREYRKTVD